MDEKVKCDEVNSAVKDETQMESSINTAENIEKNVESNTDRQIDTTKEVEKSDGGYFGYYIFTILSAMIGLVIVFFLTRLLIDEAAENGTIDLVKMKNPLSAILAFLAAIVFVIIAVNFKKVLKKIFLSEIFLYLYIGFLTTSINIIAFKILLDTIGKGTTETSPNWKLAEILAFIIAFLFAFIADKLVVFKSYNLVPTKLFSEFGMFLGARLFTEAINFMIMYVLIDKMSVAEFTTKIIASVIIIVINYLLSKFVIFKKVQKKDINEQS